MKKSMSLLKREHENKYLELTGILNKLKTRLIQKDICVYCENTNFRGAESRIYGKEIVNDIYAKASEATGGDICLSIEDRRKEAFSWLFDIEFDNIFYQAPYIFTQKTDEMLDNLVYVKDINDGDEDDTMKTLVQEAIEKLKRSIDEVKRFDVETVEYSYSCDTPKINKIKEFADIVERVLRYER